MGNAWWARMGVIMLTVLLAVYTLIPTMIAEDAMDTLQAQATGLSEEDAQGAEPEEEVEVTGWRSWLPDAQIALGLDLQGGIDLTLEVETMEAVLSTVARDIQSISDTAKNDGVVPGEIRRVRGEPSLEFNLGETGDLDELRGLLARRYQDYEYKTSSTDEKDRTWHRFTVTEIAITEISKKTVEQALETLRSRVDATGVKEPSIVLKGGSKINVQLPGIDNLDQAYAALGTTAVLEFYLLDEDFGDAALERAVKHARENAPTSIYEDDGALNDWLQDEDRITRDHRILWEYKPDPEGGEDLRSIPTLLKDRAVLTGDDINDASVGMDQFNDPYTALEFKPAGGQIFCDITGENVGKRFAIVLDRKVRSSPVIREKICGGRASISMGAGDYTKLMDEAQVLSLVLRTGALPAPVSIGEARIVGAQLGEDSIKAGRTGLLVGGAIVLFFMAVYYRKSGVVADLALTCNVLFVLALLAGFGATLTLPGIAGIALTIGMAVDANIIVFERIREELRTGRTARSAVDAGYEYALSAVLDANITTAIAGVVLFSYGTGPIKGFAVTLLIGIATTLYTAIFVCRTFMDFVVRRSTAQLGL
jgi:preprotein translocase subunit SecD